MVVTNMRMIEEELEVDEKMAESGAAGLPVAAEFPAYLEAEAEAHEGEGVSTDASDNIVPLVYVIQKGSPQVDQSDPRYEPSARAGSIWLRNYSEPFVPGDRGILVQAVDFWKDFGEWVPRSRGGGMMGRHGYRLATDADARRAPSSVDLGDRRGNMAALGRLEPGEEVPDCNDAFFTTDPKTRQRVWARPGDAGAMNELVFTRSHAVRVHVAPGVALNYVIPFSSTGHTVSKEWMGKFLAKRTPRGKILPSWSALYRLTTRQKSRAGNTWYLFQVQDAGYASLADVRAGRALKEAFSSGEKAVEEVAGDVGGGADGSQGVAAGDVRGEDDIPF